MHAIPAILDFIAVDGDPLVVQAVVPSESRAHRFELSEVGADQLLIKLLNWKSRQVLMARREEKR